MDRKKETKIKIWRQQNGASLIEYGLIATFISIVSIGVVSQVGGNVRDTFDLATTATEDATDLIKTKPSQDPDSTPTPQPQPIDIAFSNAADAAPNSYSETASALLEGPDGDIAILIQNGEYKINDADWTQDPGVARAGDNLAFRVLTGSQLGTYTTNFTIGDKDFSYSATVLDGDPESFSFATLSDGEQNTQYESNSVTLSGFEKPLPISIDGGEYKLNDGSWTSIEGQANPGDTLQVRLTTGEEFGPTTARVTVGPQTATFEVFIPDTIPDAFAFNPDTDAPANTRSTSNAVTLTGINTEVPISISNGEYRLNGGSWTSAQGVINNNDTVQVRLTTGTQFREYTTTLTVSDTSASYTATVLDNDPDVFSYENRNDGRRNTTFASFQSPTISGLGKSVPVSVSGEGAEYRIYNGSSWSPWSNGTRTISNGQNLQARITTGNQVKTYTATLTVGARNGTFSVDVQDDVPNAFPFTAVASAQPNTRYESNAINVSDIDIPSRISVVGGQYRVRPAGSGTVESFGPWTSSAGTVTLNEDVQVRLTTGSSSRTYTATVTIGGVDSNFNVTVP